MLDVDAQAQANILAMETYITDRFSLLAGIASDWWWEMDADLRFTFLSERFTEVFGVPASALVGKRRNEPERTDYGNPAWQAHLEDLAKQRPFRNFETTFVDVSGVSRPVMISGTPIFGPDGAFNGYVGVGHDLTERRRRENEVAAHATHLEAILQSIDQGVVLIDADLRIVDYNQRLVEFLRLDANQNHRGASYEDITRELARRGEYAPEEEEAAVALRLRLVRSRERVQKERKLPDGRIVSVTFNPLPAGGGVMTYTDVTDARAREERQHELMEQIDQERARLVTAQAVAKVGSWETNLETLEVMWSAETFRIFGLDPATYSPKRRSFLAYVHPDDLTRVNEAFEYWFAIPGSHMIQHRIVTPGGELKFVVERWRITVDEDGEPLRAIGTCQDLTELKLAQQKADEAANLLLVAGRAARLGGWTADVATGQVVWSEVTAEIHEAPKGFSPTVGKGLAYYPPEYRAQAKKALFNCAQKGKAFDETLQILTAKGNRVWVRAIGEAVRDGSGKIISVHGAFQDISTMKAQEEQLTLLEAAVSRLNDIVLITEAEPLDEPGPRVVYANDAFSKLTGYDVSEIIGKTPRILQGPTTARSELARIRAALEARQPVRAEVSNFAKDGKEYVLEIDIAPIFDAAEKLTHFVAVERDVTARKAAERRLSVSEERFRTVARVTADMVWDWNIAEGTIWRNDQGIAWLGSLANAPIFSAEWSELIHPEDRDRLRASLQASIEGSNIESSDEYRLRRADGSHAQVVARAAVIRDDAGKAIRIVGSTVDVSEQRRLEGQLRESQKLDALGQLTGGVAHDFNNILMVIMANAEQMLEDEHEATDAKRHIEGIIGAAERAAQLTRQLLAFSRKQTLRLQRTNLNDLTATTGRLLRRTLGEHIQIDTLLADDLWTTDTDRAQVEAALINLCINARDAMPEGGRLLIETRNASLDEEYVARNPEATAGNYVMLSVTDTGSGMPPEVMNKVFEPFFTTKEVGKGTGLGLSMVYGFVKQSLGHVAIYSEVGHGTAVKLYLPRSMPEQTIEPADQRTDVPRGMERILLVEDEEQVRGVVSMQLTNLGYAVTAVGNGAEALASLSAGQSYDLLLTDVVMPGLFNGKALADEAKKRDPALRVLFMSGYSENAISTLGILDEDVTLISKPFSRAELAKAVRGIMEASNDRG